MKRSFIIALSSVAITATACSTPTPDAYGSFEATEIVISAEYPGRILAINAAEGSQISEGATVATIDTSALPLQKAELIARKSAISSRINEVNAQEGVINAQLSVAQQEFDRTQRLFGVAAATSQQLDRATRDLRTLEAQAATIKASKATISREMGTIDAQLSQLDDRVRRHTIIAPSGGTVLARYVEPGELAQPGTPVVRIANLDTIIFRAYVSERQLGLVKAGDEATVQVDTPDGMLKPLVGRITWISSRAEFTPTPIQTREERVTQVYAVKVAVANPDGAVKIGMPGELILQAGGGAGAGASSK